MYPVILLLLNILYKKCNNIKLQKFCLIIISFKSYTLIRNIVISIKLKVN